MIAPRTTTVLLAVALATVGCSNTDTASSASSPEASKTSSPAASPTPSSAFCLDLSTFQIGVLAFRAGVAKAIDGQALDFKDLRRKATLTLRTGKEMKASAPPDIAEEFRTVLKAIKTSSSRLKEGSKVRDIVDPVYGKETKGAFEALHDYECKSSGN